MRTPSVVALTLVAGLALAQAPETGEDEIEAEPVFHVEMIVFRADDFFGFEEDLRHATDAQPLPRLLSVPEIELESLAVDDPAAASAPPASEPAPPAPGAPAPGASTDNAPPLTDPTGAAPLADPTGAAPPPTDRLTLFTTREPRGGSAPEGFRVLERAELELGADAAALGRDSRYTVLAHTGWALTGVDTDRSVPLDLKWLGITNPSGRIEVYLRRFLHASLDLEFHEGAGTRWQAPQEFGLAPFEQAERLRLEEEVNAMRSDELHYVDHPRYGVLIRITRAPEPVEEPAG